MSDQGIFGGRYQVLNRLGGGGASQVYRVRDLEAGGVLALKLFLGLNPPPDEVARFHREFRLLARLSHPHIVSVAETGEHEGSPYFTMELLSGETLAQHLGRADDTLCQALRGDPALLREVLAQICGALGYVHGQGLVHRDLKPANIMVTPGHAVPHVTVLDLGTARFRGRDEVRTTRVGTMLGTVQYMSPEQIRGVALDGRADLYSLGVVLYELLCGKRPFDGDGPATVAVQHLRELPVPPRVHSLEVPHDLQLMTLRLLEKEPTRRYRTAEDLVLDLRDPDGPDVGQPPELERPVLLLHPRFSGRRDEMASARSALADLGRGIGGFLAVSGPPGIGKSRFVEELSGDARSQGMRVFSSACFSDRTFSLLPVVEGIRDGAVSLGGLGNWVDEESRSVLARVFVELAPDSVPDTAPSPFRQADQVDIFRRVLGLLESLAKAGPIVFCLEDVQWADRATHAFLGLLANRLAQLPLLLIVTHRPIEAPDEGAPWRQRAVLLPLPPLGPESTAETVASMLGTVDVPDDLAAQVHGISGGNPLFIGEAVETLVDRDAIVWKKERWVYRGTSGPLPERLEWLIQERVGGLPPGSRSILNFAAVLARPASFDLLAQASGLSEAELYDRLSDLVGRDLLSRDGVDRYSLVHALVSEAIRNSMSASEARAVHRHVAESLSRGQHGVLSGPPGEVAHHFLRAGERSRAVPFLVSAGDASLAAYAHTEAREAYEQALRIVEGQEGDAFGGAAFSRGLACSYVEVLVRTGDLEAAVARARQALSRDGHTPLQRARLTRNLGIGLMRAGRYGESLAALRESLEVSRAAGSDREIIASRFQLANLCWLTGRMSDATEHVADAAEACEAVGDALYRAGGTYLLAHDHLTNSRLKEAETGFGNALEAFVELGDSRYVNACRMSLQEVYTYQGRLETAEALLDSAVEAYRSQGLSGVAGCELDLGYVRFLSGNREGARTCYNSACRQLDASTNRRKLALAHVRMSELALAEGDASEALAHAVKAGDVGSSDAIRVSQVQRALGKAQATAGRRKAAEKAFRAAVEAVRGRPGVHLALALLDAGAFHTSAGSLQLAEDCLGRAVGMLEAMGAHQFLQVARVAWEELMDAKECQAGEPSPEPETVATPSPRRGAGFEAADLLDRAADRLLDVTDAERGLILAVRHGIPRLQTASSRNLDERNVEDISRSIVQQAIDSNGLVETLDAPNDPRFQESKSILDYGIRSVLCAPLRSSEGTVIGVAYADHRGVDFYSGAQTTFFSAFAEFVGVALEGLLKCRELQESYERLAVGRSRLGDLVGSSQAMQGLYDLIERLADTDITVLLQGETGTGKGLIARTIHDRSVRSSGPFLDQNCGALPRDLLESELFGHRKGAFTSSTADRQGLFEAAAGGTVFLDEIGDAPQEVQVRLLHVLEEGTVKRVGENHSRKVDIRVVAAANRDLEHEVESGRFRKDLFYRLNAIPVTVPPLRDRADDIPLLADHFLGLFQRTSGKSVEGFGSEVVRAFSRYSWPGNLRELENEVRRGLVLADPGGRIGLEHLSEHLVTTVGPGLGAHAEGPLKAAVEAFEAEAIRSALQRNAGNVTRTAERLGISRVGLQRKMRKYGLRSQQFR